MSKKIIIDLSKASLKKRQVKELNQAISKALLRLSTDQEVIIPITIELFETEPKAPILKYGINKEKKERMNIPNSGKATLFISNTKSGDRINFTYSGAGYAKIKTDLCNNSPLKIDASTSPDNLIVK